MYHLQLRQFPNHATRFNLTERELRAVLEPWTRQQIVEVGERKWAPERATLTVLEGPRLEVQQLAMGRGWRAAQRTSTDVTERMLAAVTAHVSASAAAPAAPQPPTPQAAATTTHAQASPTAAAARGGTPGSGYAPLSDPLSLAMQLASLLGNDPERLLAAWREMAARSSGLAPSETLALAERHIANADPG